MSRKRVHGTAKVGAMSFVVGLGVGYPVWGVWLNAADHWNNAVIETVGTWVGGVGTMLAVGFAAWELGRQGRNEAHQQRMLERDLQQVEVQTHLGYDDEINAFTRVDATVVNGSNQVLTAVTLRLPGAQPSEHDIGRLTPSSRSGARPHEFLLDKAIDNPGEVEFTDGGQRGDALSEKTRLEASAKMKNLVVLTFMVNGELWEREGLGPVTRAPISL